MMVRERRGTVPDEQPERVVQLDRRQTTTRRRERRAQATAPVRQLRAFDRLESLESTRSSSTPADLPAHSPVSSDVDDFWSTPGCVALPTPPVDDSCGRTPTPSEPVRPIATPLRTRHDRAAGRRWHPPHRASKGIAALSLVAVLGVTTAVTQPVAAQDGTESPAVESSAHHTFTGLALGSRGDAVRALQQALIDAGISVAGGADGIFGPKTREALEQFQASQGLGQTGSVDSATAQALASGNSSPTPTSSTPDSIVGLGPGAEGELVEQLQRALVDMGVWLNSINGRYDAATERGVRQFQNWNGLGVTGTVTEATARALNGTRFTPTEPDSPTDVPTPPSSGSADDGAGAAYVGLTRGSQGTRVADLQRALIDAGVSVVGGADGVFGPMTQAALVEFQRARGLSATGVVGAEDVAALGLSGGEPVSPAASATYLGLAQGARGEPVASMQRALIAAGVTVAGGADGIFGPKTKAALVSYQSSHGIAANGVVDEATIQHLGLGSNSGPQPFSPAPEPEAAEAPAPAPESDNPYVGLAEGDSGPLVLELQRGLQRFGFVIIGGADGNFGPSTASTLRAFQSVNAIPQTGVLTERGATILELGSGKNVPTENGGGNGSFQMERFPVQGLCFFGDTWHAPRGGGRLHEGTDIIADEGKLLYAVVDGTISRLYWDQPGALSGNGLRIAQDDGTYFTYLHMLGFAPGIELGTEVKAGDVIGWVGNTGSSATPHLHFEIHPGGGAAINPYPYLKAMDDCGNTTPQHQSSFAPSS